jgi:hypothetical protein
MTHVQHRISTLLLAGALAVVTIAAIPATAAVAADTPGTGTCTTTITGPLTGALTAAVGTTCLTNVTLHGAITVNPGAALSVVGSTIYGAITTNGASAFTFCNSSTVGGAISVATSSGFILIGDGGDATGTPCSGGHIDGAVTLNANSGGVELGGNNIGGAVKVTANVAPTSGVPVEDAATEIEGNSIGGTLTCSGNTPVPTDDGSPNTVSSSRTGETCASSTF